MRPRTVERASSVPLGSGLQASGASFRRRAHLGGRPVSALAPPPVPEGLLRRLAQIARRAPARQRPGQVSDAALARERAGPHPRGCLRPLVGPPRREGAEHRVHRDLLGLPRRLGVHHPAAQVHEHPRDVDRDRADLVTGSAQARGIRQRAPLLEPLELGGEDRSDRPGVHRLVRVAAGSRVHRADVEAGRAADAAKRLASDLVGEHVGAPVVDQHQVELLRPVARAHAGPERGVRVHALAGGRARQQLQEHLHVAPRRHELLDPHHGHEHLGERGAHAPVALRLEHADRAGLRDREVGAGDPDAGRQELRPQMQPGRLRERRRLIGQVGQVELAREQLADLGAVLVDGGHEDVGLDVVAELDDQLRQVGLDRAHARLAPAPR